MGVARGSKVQGMCGCGNMVALLGKNKDGITVYRNVCNTCHRNGRRQKGPQCQLCGFVAVDRIQLDIDHIDGNRSNNDPSNLQTLCANCHRLKTKRNKDGVYAKTGRHNG
jgi:5-methylcytosine-specific restriction endonuclease McrA